MRDKHIEFIMNDTKERGETIVSNIRFAGALYQLKVKIDGSERRKTVDYSAAAQVMKGYREIKVD